MARDPDSISFLRMENIKNQDFFSIRDAAHIRPLKLF
jgi:hypothetical protein